MNSNQGECKQGPQGSPWAPGPVQSRGLGQAPPWTAGLQAPYGGYTTVDLLLPGTGLGAV